MAKKNEFEEFSKTILGGANIAESFQSPENGNQDGKTTRENAERHHSRGLESAPRQRETTPSINSGYVQRSFYLREDLSDQLARIALLSKRSIKSIMNEIIQDFVDKNRRYL